MNKLLIFFIGLHTSAVGGFNNFDTTKKQFMPSSEISGMLVEANLLIDDNPIDCGEGTDA